MACVRIRACHSAFYPIDGRSAHSEISWLDRGGGQSAPVSRVRRPGAVDAQRRRRDLFVGAVCAGAHAGSDTVRLAGPARWRQRLETAAAWRRRYDAAGHPADPFLARDHRSVGRPRCMDNRRRTAPLDRRPDPVAHHILAERQQECRRRFAAPGVLRTPEERGNATHGILADRRTYLPRGYALPREQNSLSALATDPGLNAWHRMQLVSTHEIPRSARPCSLPAQRPNTKTIPPCYRTGSRRKKNGLFCMMRSWFRHFLPQNHGFCGPSPPDRRPRTRRRPAHLRRTAILACAPGSSSTAARSGNSTRCRNRNWW